jgi:catechol 2,3-dioxygenase-like lactoylglutathione lyase family enzyme
MARPVLSGVHHIKLAASDIRKTQAWYTDILGLKYIPQYDHKTADGDLFAVLLSLDQMLVEVRLDATQAQKDEGWNPITWAVPLRKDLEEWKAWFELNGVKCSRVFVGLKGWVVCALDPDGKMVRIYCDEAHEMTTDFDHDDFWLA